MKDYSLSPEEQKKYILSYEMKDNEIILKLATGEHYIIPFNKKNEQLVKSRMEGQARNAKVKPLDTKNKLIYKITLCLLPLVAICAIKEGALYLYYILGMYIAAAGILSAQRIIRAVKKRNIKKLDYYLDYEQEFNEKVKSNKNMLSNVSKKAIKEIESREEQNDKPFSLNNIDNYSLKDLRILKSNFERIRSFGFDETQKETEEKKDVLTLTMIKKNK